MEAFRVWTSLEIKGNALKQMERFSVLTSRAEKHIKMLSQHMIALNQRFLILDKRLMHLSPQSEKLSVFFRSMNTASAASGRNFSLLSEKTALLSTEIKKLSADASIAAASLIRMDAASKINAISGTGGRGRALTHRGAPHFPTSAGAMMGAAGLGGGLAVGALGAGMLMHKGFEKNVEYGKMISQLQAIGFTPEQISESKRITSGASPGMSPLDKMQALIDAQMATRKFSDAKVLAPSLQKMKFISQAMFSGMSEDQMKSAVRIAEIRGGANPNKVKEELSTVMQMYTTSAGTIDPTAFLAFFRRYQGSSKLSRQALLALEPTMQEIKPTTVGVALQTLYGRMHGGVKLTNRDMGFLTSIGLFEKGAIKKNYADILDKDPEMFFEKVWLPLLKKHGITSEEGVSRAGIHLGRTPSVLFSTFEKNKEKAARAREQGSRLMGLDDLMKTAFQTESGAALRFMKALESLILAIGKISAPGIITGLNMMASLMERMSKTFGSDTQRQDLDKAIGVSTKPIDWSSAFHHFMTSPVTGAKMGTPVQVNQTIHLDGKAIAKTVTQHQSAQMTRGGTQSAPNGINARMTPVPAGVNNLGGFN